MDRGKSGEWKYGKLMEMDMEAVEDSATRGQ